MKKILVLLTMAVLLTVACNAQPNSTSTYEVGIVNPVAGKTYVFFKEVKTDSASSQLVNNMDYLNPNVSSLITPLTNFRTVGDTLLGDFTVPDAVEKRYIKGGLIQRDNGSLKYSGMTVTYWMQLDQLEQRPGFFMRKK